MEGFGGGGQHQDTLSSCGDGKTAVHPVFRRKRFRSLGKHPECLQFRGEGDALLLCKVEDALLNLGIRNKGKFQRFKDGLFGPSDAIMAIGAQNHDDVTAAQTVGQSAPEKGGNPRFHRLTVAGQAQLGQKAAHMAHNIRICRCAFPADADDFCLWHGSPPFLIIRIDCPGDGKGRLWSPAFSVRDAKTRRWISTACFRLP